jgi:NRAMP (natural resistance-associated macrophage protein)-like metal ion transporter
MARSGPAAMTKAGDAKATRKPTARAHARAAKRTPGTKQASAAHAAEAAPTTLDEDLQELAGRLGPGLITGAADDDPSGIATYSQAGAQFRFGLVWTILLTTPLMVGIQTLSARIGWATGRGLAANIDRICPRWLTLALVGLLVVANTINIAADVGAMGEAAKLIVGGPQPLYVLAFGTLSIGMQIAFSYERTVRLLKWLTLTLFAYVAVVLAAGVPWRQAIVESLQPWAFVPKGTTGKEVAAMVVAVLGTTISPYLFFWQATQEVEDGRRRPESHPVRHHGAYASEHLSRIKQDTIVGMGVSNVVALCIIVATAVTLNERGVTNVQTAAQAAEALRPVAGEFACLVFGLGIVGTGLLAVPVLAGSAAYAVSELFGWKAGLSRGFHEARGFYSIIIAATGIGSAMGFLDVDPMKALVASAIVNGVISVPIMVALMLIGQSKTLMGRFTISARHRALGWAATAIMAVAVAFMFATSV